MTRQLLIPRILWLGFFSSVFIYLGVLFMISPEEKETAKNIAIFFSFPAIGSVGVAIAMRIKAAAVTRRNEEDVALRRRVLDLITYACIETLAIYGLMVGYLGAEKMVYLLYFAAAVVGFVAVAPRESDYPR